jgi:hypothetical protein
MYIPDRKGWNENCGNHICWPKFLRCFWDLKTAWLQCKCKLATYQSSLVCKKRKQVQINSTHSRGASSCHQPIQCFQNLQISYVSQILQWIPTKPNDGEAKGSLLELFQKDFFRIYHWRKVVCLFSLSHLDLPNHSASCHALGTIGKPLMSRGVHRVRFIMFRPTVQKLLNIEHFVQWKLILIKTKNYRGISAHSSYFGKPSVSRI